MPWGRDVDVLAKLEMLNPSGSIKDRTAKYMIEKGIANGEIDGGSHLIESSSGNFAIAIALAAKAHGLLFTCVVDPTICRANLRILELLGATVHMVRERDETGGYLKTRLAQVHELLDQIDGAVWMNQYANQANWRAHYEGTAQEILDEIGMPPDYLVAAVSTTGTIMGIARRLTKVYPRMRVVAVDAEGSAIFGASAHERHLPGIGSSIKPEILDSGFIDDVLYVSAAESVAGAYELVAAEGLLAGASSGAVIAAIKRLVADAPSGSRLVTVFPDRGERYLDVVFGEGSDGVRSSLPLGADPRRHGVRAAQSSTGLSG